MRYEIFLGGVMTEEYLEELKSDFEKIQKAFANALMTIRTGRASPQLIEGVSIMVASYGSSMPLRQLANITAPDARLLVVNPWDKGTIIDIEKGIRMADLGLNPNNDGQVIRVPIPPLTSDRRKDLVRKVRKILEDYRIRARSVRKEYNDMFKELEAEKEISEDELRRLQDRVQKSTDGCTQGLEQAAKAKEQEVLEV